jgi:hypothetical protein
MEQGEKREEGEEVSVARGELWGRSSITSSNSVICERVSSKLNKKEKEREWFWKFAPTYTEEVKSLRRAWKIQLTAPIGCYGVESECECGGCEKR